MIRKVSELEDSIASAFCEHFCSNECMASEQKDFCFCVEGAMIATNIVLNYKQNRTLDTALYMQKVSKPAKKAGELTLPCKAPSTTAFNHRLIK